MFSWKVIYNDGTSLSQLCSDGSRNKYTDIDRDNLKQFLVLDENKPEPVLVVHFVRPTQKLIYRQRKHMALDGTILGVVWIVGWQENQNGKNVQMIFFLHPNGFVEVLDKFRPDTRLYYPIKFRPEEEVDT